MSGRAMRWIAIALATFLILLVVADRVGVYVAEQAAGDMLESSQHLDSRPDVDIAGFPFLTQLVAGNFDKITVTADDVPVGRRLHLLVISRLQVVLHELSVSRDFDSVHADTASATAIATFGELGKTLGVDLSYAGSGRIKATKTVTVAGASAEATVTTRPMLADGTLSFSGTSVDNAGPLSRAAVASLEQIFQLVIPLQNMPFNVHVQALEVGEDGVTLELTGRDLVYSN
jgi:hypothetical protein